MKTHQLIETLVKGFINHPDDLRVVDTSSTIVMGVNADDYPKVIGSRGSTFKSLELIADVAAAKRGDRVRLVLPAPRIGEEKPLTPFRADLNWSRTDWIVDLLQTALDETIGEGSKIAATDAEDTTVLGAEIPVSLVAQWTVAEFEDALGKIFHAIGKANGRNVFVDLSPMEKEAIA